MPNDPASDDIRDEPELQHAVHRARESVEILRGIVRRAEAQNVLASGDYSVLYRALSEIGDMVKHRPDLADAPTGRLAHPRS